MSTSQETVPSHRRGPAHSVAIAGGLVLLALLFLLPSPVPSAGGSETLELLHGRIVEILPGDPETGTESARVLILDGNRAGQTVTAILSLGGGPDQGGPGGPDQGGQGATTPAYGLGDEVVLQVSDSGDGEFIAVADRWRVPLLLGVLGLFALLVTIVAGWRGVRALLALAFTVGVVVKILLPLLVQGWDPVLLAVGTGSAVTVITLLLTEGFRRSTAAAAIGTFTALVATAVLAAIVTEAARFSVLQGSEEVAFLRSIVGADVQVGGLLLASIILGALGVLDDVTITQAVTVEELAASDPAASRATLAGRAMRIGRSHIAATMNTLVLAYVAAALPLLLLFSLSPQPIGAIASGEFIAIEVLRAIIGSIGIVLAVPFTTFVAARLVPRAGRPDQPAHPGHQGAPS